MIRKNYRAAEDAYQQIIDIDAEQIQAYRGLYNIYRIQGKTDEGMSRLEDLIAQVDSSTAAVAVSEIHFANDNVAEGEQYLSVARRRDPESAHARALSATVHFQRAARHVRAGSYAEARTSIFTALTSYPGNRQMLGLLTEVEISSGELREARKVLREMRRIHPSAVLVDVLEGDLLVAEGKPAEAPPHYASAWEKTPSDVAASKYYRTLMAVGRNAEAVPFLTTWRETFPSSVLATITSGDYWISAGDNARAMKLYEDLLVRVPDSPAALNNLALLYLDERSVDEALPLAEKAYNLASHNPRIGDTYGWILYKAGDVERAYPILKEAAQIGPDLESVKQHLAEVQSSRGRGG